MADRILMNPRAGGLTKIKGKKNDNSIVDMLTIDAQNASASINGTVSLGGTIDQNFNGPLNKITGNLSVPQPTGTIADQSGQFVLSSNLNFFDTARSNRYSSIIGGVGLYFDTRASDTNQCFGLYVNKAGDTLATDAVAILTATQAGSVTLGAVATTNQHIVQGGDNPSVYIKTATYTGTQTAALAFGVTTTPRFWLGYEVSANEFSIRYDASSTTLPALKYLTVSSTGAVTAGPTGGTTALNHTFNDYSGGGLTIKTNKLTVTGTEHSFLSFRGTSNAGADFDLFKIKSTSTNGGSALSIVEFFQNGGASAIATISSGAWTLGAVNDSNTLVHNLYGRLGVRTAFAGDGSYVYRKTSTSTDRIFYLASDVGGTEVIKWYVNADGGMTSTGALSVGSPTVNSTHLFYSANGAVAKFIRMDDNPAGIGFYKNNSTTGQALFNARTGGGMIFYSAVNSESWADIGQYDDAGNWTRGPSSKANHKDNGYVSINGSGTSGSATGEHPYFAVKKLIANEVNGSTTVAHGLTGARIKRVTAKLYDGTNNRWFNANTGSAGLYWDDTNITVSSSWNVTNGIVIYIDYEAS